MVFLQQDPTSLLQLTENPSYLETNHIPPSPLQNSHEEYRMKPHTHTHTHAHARAKTRVFFFQVCKHALFYFGSVEMHGHIASTNYKYETSLQCFHRRFSVSIDDNEGSNVIAMCFPFGFLLPTHLQKFMKSNGNGKILSFTLQKHEHCTINSCTKTCKREINLLRAKAAVQSLNHY